MGGMVAAIECLPQSEIASGQVMETQRQIERKERIVVGVNAFQSEDQSFSGTEDSGNAKSPLKRLRGERSDVNDCLDAAMRAAASSQNDGTIPHGRPALMQRWGDLRCHARSFRRLPREKTFYESARGVGGQDCPS
jgi:methylmalonyl-CoA mutase N-terminal domain/subunit